MKRVFSPIVACLLVMCLAGFASAKEKKPKPGPLTAAWECMSHGGSQGDMPFTLYLEQTKETVTGLASAAMGSADITSGTYKKKKLDLRIETPQGTYLVTGKLKKGQLSGEWSIDNTTEKGTWEGKKQPTTTQ